MPLAMPIVIPILCGHFKTSLFLQSIWSSVVTGKVVTQRAIGNIFEHNKYSASCVRMVLNHVRVALVVLRMRLKNITTNFVSPIKKQQQIGGVEILGCIFDFLKRENVIRWQPKRRILVDDKALTLILTGFPPPPHPPENHHGQQPDHSQHRYNCPNYPKHNPEPQGRLLPGRPPLRRLHRQRLLLAERVLPLILGARFHATTILTALFELRQDGSLPIRRLLDTSTQVRFRPHVALGANAPLSWFLARLTRSSAGRENRNDGIGPRSLLDDRSSALSRLSFSKLSGISDLNELFASERRTRLVVPRDGNLGPREFLLRSSSSRGGRSGTVPLSRLSVRARVATDWGISPSRKLALRLRSWRDLKRLILGGKGPHSPRETRDSFCRLESLVRTVKKESIENFLERGPPGTEKLAGERVGIRDGEVRLPTMVSSVTWLSVQTMAREGVWGRKQKLVQLVQVWSEGGNSRSWRAWNKILVSLGDSWAVEDGRHWRRSTKMVAANSWRSSRRSCFLLTVKMEKSMDLESNASLSDIVCV
ncbi:vacuolar sorting receptor [Striga asiatica]|uniref:Vacuolar sorting receptor n=1 Tax=Striga asiatica TaxID=4170 RepID=A0A5A7PHK7_STRAF|nr:vacuolar sorting receptor [Striga asiatica]